MRTSRAFTLVELLIAVAVAAVLVTLAAPSFRDFILMQRLKGIHAQLVTDLQFARTEAISRGVEVNVRVQTTSATTLGTCYVIFTDPDWDYQSFGASSRCSCRNPEESGCKGEPLHPEIRTVQLPASSGVKLSVPSGQGFAVAFDPVTGGMVLTISETGVGTGNAFTIHSYIDTARTLSAVIALSGRPTVCRPMGSTMNEPAC